MFLKKIREKMNSDKAAMGAVETILLVALAVFGILIILNYIMKPLQSTSEGIGNTITEMNPE